MRARIAVPLRRELPSHGQRRCDAALPVGRRAEASGRLPAAHRPRIGVEFGAQPGDLGRRLGTTALQRRPAAERGGAGRRPHPHAVLRHPLERGVARLQHRRETVDQQSLQHGAVRDPELGQRGVVHADPAAQPLEADVLAAEPVHCAGTAHALHCRVEPECQQNARVGRRMAGTALDRLDRAVQRGEIEPLGEAPDEARPVIRRQQVLQADRPQAHLPPLSLAQPRSPAGARRGPLPGQNPEQTSFGARRHPAHRVTISPNLLRHCTDGINRSDPDERFTGSELAGDWHAHPGPNASKASPMAPQGPWTARRAAFLSSAFGSPKTARSDRRQAGRTACGALGARCSTTYRMKCAYRLR
jgi:hypothetical protein